MESNDKGEHSAFVLGNQAFEVKSPMGGYHGPVDM